MPWGIASVEEQVARAAARLAQFAYRLVTLDIIDQMFDSDLYRWIPVRDRGMS
jgi:hypothetical protein